MTAGNVYITLELDNIKYRKKVYPILRRLMKIDLRWKRFFCVDYWVTWIETANVWIEGYRRKEWKSRK